MCSFTQSLGVRGTWPLAVATLAVALCLGTAASVPAQVVSTLGNAVGGVAIDPQGMLRNMERQALEQVRKDWEQQLEPVPQGLAGKCELRKVSLRNLDAAIAQCVREGKKLPDAAQFLGGLQQVRYVLVYPDRQDIVLVGPAEGWKVGPQGTMVGVSTGRPVLLLDDLVVALRSVAAPARSVMSCSIDPTPEGLRRVGIHVKGLHTIGNPRQTAAGIEEQLGPQKITLQGVPETSHFARVMVAADYRMKSISMGLEPSPVAGLPSFLGLMQASGRGMKNMLPRWWLAPDYGPLARDPDGLAWEIRKASVKAMAENDFFNAAGLREKTVGADPVSQKWAEQMTARYDDLAQAEPAFGELRNCIDLAVVAALITQENLLQKAGASLPMLTGSDGIRTASMEAPRQVATGASLVKKGRNWMIAAGGVQINPWAIAANSQPDASLANTRAQTTFAADSWWSN